VPAAPAAPADGVDVPLPRVLSSLVTPGGNPFLAVVESGIVVALGELLDAAGCPEASAAGSAACASGVASASSVAAVAVSRYLVILRPIGISFICSVCYLKRQDYAREPQAVTPSEATQWHSPRKLLSGRSHDTEGADTWLRIIVAIGTLGMPPPGARLDRTHDRRAQQPRGSFNVTLQIADGVKCREFDTEHD
jgi:hypothetical protein